MGWEMKTWVVFVLLAATGCTTATESSVAANDPAPINYAAQSKAAIRGALKDPFSVKEFKLTKPFRAGNDSIWKGKWQTCATFYAKNGFGGTQPGDAYVTFDKGKVVDVGIGNKKDYHTECASAVSTSWE